MAPTTMPAPASPQAPYPPRRSNGCLWGCLIVILIPFLSALLIGGYTSWFLNYGYRRDPVLRLVGELVREDGTAQAVLGEPITIAGLEGNYFSWMPGSSRHAYAVTLEGPRGEGHLAVTSHQDVGGPRLDSAILIGPDGRRYDLLQDGRKPDTPDTSI